VTEDRRIPGFHGHAGFGRRPALVVVDVNLGFTDPRSPLVCDLDDVVGAIGRLLVETRAAGLPVVYTTVAYDEAARRTAAAFIEKVPALLTLEAGSRWVEIDPRIAPLPDEPVLNKLFASAFFGTSLASFLAAERCDTVIVTGASTSGCIRATVVDALQHGYRPVVPREAVGDRNPTAHDANLYDMDAKYADVVSVEETLAHLAAAGAERVAG
jgi:maleamate amidohydrolase